MSKISARNDRENGTSITDESNWIKNASDSVIQVDDFFDDESIIETFETEATNDTTAVVSSAASNANAYEMEKFTIVTQNISDTHSSNDG